MHIVSYRGPDQPDQVSTSIQKTQSPSSSWWYLQDGHLQVASSEQHSCITSIPATIIDGHFRYCNEFIRPLMHGCSDIARYEPSDRNCYRSLNVTIASFLNWSPSQQTPFIHDYQFALLPGYLRQDKLAESIYFWHIPWFKSCPPDAQAAMQEIARSLLQCKIVGFHTREYMDNFRRFILDSLPEYTVTADGTTVVHQSGQLTKLWWRHPTGGLEAVPSIPPARLSA